MLNKTDFEKNTTFKGGLNLNFFDNAHFESVSNLSGSNHYPIIAKNVLRLLMMGWSSHWADLISWELFSAVFIDRNHDLLRELRLAFQQGLENVFKQLKDKKLSPEESEQVQLFLSNCLATLPFSDLTPFESIKIPQLIDEEWTLVEYEVVPIELTPQTGFRSFLLEDHDRVFSYGLEPIFNSKAQPHLIFMGTTPPSGQGHIPQTSANYKGLETVGETLYESGRDRILEWVSKQNKKIHVCGASQGGSIGAICALDIGYYISRADLLNPAGLHDKNKGRFDNWDKCDEKPQVVVQKQGNDPVSRFGEWKEDWEIIRVKPPGNKKGPNGYFDHILNYAGFAETEFTFTDPKEDNKERASRNFWFYTVGRTILYYSIILPFNYVVRPTWNFIWNNKASLAPGLILPGGMAVLITLLSLGIIPAPIVIGASILLTVISASLIGANLLNDSRFKNTLSEFFGKSSVVRHAKIHDPNLSRNPTMDLYHVDNTHELELTYKDIHSYYHVTRQLLKNKQLIPNETKSVKYSDGLSKKELLEASLDTENSDKKIVIKPTKAKALHITHTLKLVNRLGLENKELKKEAEYLYEHYVAGKTKACGFISKEKVTTPPVRHPERSEGSPVMQHP